MIQHFDNNRNMDERTAVTALAALAQGARLRVFRALVGAGPEGMTPSSLSILLDITGSTLSFHLKELVHAGLVDVQRNGRHLHYRPAFVRMNEVLAYLTDHCCQGRPGAAPSACAPSCIPTTVTACGPTDAPSTGRRRAGRTAG